MVDMSPQDFENMGKILDPNKPDEDDAYPENVKYGAGEDAQPASGYGQMTGDPRDRKHKFDIFKIDYKWVDNETSKKELKGAYNCLKDDGGFPELQAYVLKKLKQVDKTFKVTEDFNNATPEEVAAANNDVLDFLNQASETDKKLRGSNATESSAKMSKDIFGNSKGNDKPAAPSQAQLDFAEEIERKRTAENEKNKGNEFMKSKEFNSAVECYTKSIGINPNEAATYSNRAMAYLKLKNYGSVIDDANKALELQPDYLKAFHRRGTAFLATNKFEEAIKDFQYILEKDPDNKGINASLQDAREKLIAKQEKA